MGTPKRGFDTSRDFVTQYTSDENDRIVMRINNGVRSNKYKDVDYDKLRLLAAEKKFSAHKSLLKVKKIEQMSKQTKENNLMKQHKLVWQKEFIRLSSLRKRLQGEIERHRREHVTEAGPCNSMYQDFEDYESHLDQEFGKFKTQTAEPVWELREDLQFWLHENMSDLKMGSPDIVQKHKEIKETIRSVQGQQKQVMEKLQYEQQSLERELGLGELGEMIHEEQDTSIHIEQGIPEAAFDLECRDDDLKVNVLQEFIHMDEVFREKLHYLEDQHSLILSSGKHGGWSEEDHFLFCIVYEQYSHEMANRRKLIIDRLRRHLPKMSRAQLVMHEEWCESNKYFRKRKQVLLAAWQKARDELLYKAKSVFMEADIAAELEEVKIEYLRKQKQVKQALFEKIHQWRCQKMEALTIQQNMLERQQEELKIYNKMEAERERKRRAIEKEKITAYHDEQMQFRKKQEERDRERLEEIQRIMAEQAKFDLERIHFREEQIQRKIEDRKRMEEDKEEEEKQREERLEALRLQVRVVAESDPERLMKNTQAWDAHVNEEVEDDININRPLFEVNSFTSNQVTSDPRIKLENRLRDAGLHNSDYARHIMSNVKPLNPPRRDMESTVFKTT
ncbi:coiled-coil domain-containing protein 148-like [Ylistrum balloti]|uniref:coiled-coil domain-containing protein 148-like n=1 Tax=Ylistrum balloti TaxID=509963 RepID=UPI002905CAD0|nr:coiled-coil domain-containing protein 148-like [Ylistrum balloti]